MPPTVPTNDLIPDYQNKAGKFFSNKIKTKWFAEYAAALHGRLVVGTFSVNSFDYWVGNLGSPIQVIDDLGNWVGPTHGPEDIPDPLILSEYFRIDDAQTGNPQGTLTSRDLSLTGTALGTTPESVHLSSFNAAFRGPGLDAVEVGVAIPNWGHFGATGLEFNDGNNRQVTTIDEINIHMLKVLTPDENMDITAQRMLVEVDVVDLGGGSFIRGHSGQYDHQGIDLFRNNVTQIGVLGAIRIATDTFDNRPSIRVIADDLASPSIQVEIEPTFVGVDGISDYTTRLFAGRSETGGVWSPINSAGGSGAFPAPVPADLVPVTFQLPSGFEPGSLSFSYTTNGGPDSGGDDGVGNLSGATYAVGTVNYGAGTITFTVTNQILSDMTFGWTPTIPVDPIHRLYKPESEEAVPVTWVTLTAYTIGDIVDSTIPTGYFFEATTNGTTGASEPTWPFVHGGTVVDGTVTWKAVRVEQNFLSHTPHGGLALSDWALPTGGFTGYHQGVEGRNIYLTPSGSASHFSFWNSAEFLCDTIIEPGMIAHFEGGAGGGINGQNRAAYLFKDEQYFEIAGYDVNVYSALTGFEDAGDGVSLLTLSNANAFMQLYASKSTELQAAPSYTGNAGFIYGAFDGKLLGLPYDGGIAWGTGDSGIYFDTTGIEDHFEVFVLGAQRGYWGTSLFSVGPTDGVEADSGPSLFTGARVGSLIPTIALNHVHDDGLGLAEAGWVSELSDDGGGATEGQRWASRKFGLVADTLSSFLFVPGNNKTGMMKAKFIGNDESVSNILAREVTAIISTDGFGNATVHSSSTRTSLAVGTAAAWQTDIVVSGGTNINLTASDGSESKATRWTIRAEWIEIQHDAVGQTVGSTD